MNIETLRVESCPICRIGELRHCFNAKALDYMFGDADFEIWRCSECGYGQTKGIESVCDAYFGGAYDIREKWWHRLIEPLLESLEKSKLRYLITDSGSDGRLLEIGCGKGRFVAAAKAAGFVTQGLEPSYRSYQYARQRLGPAVIQGGIEELNDSGVVTGRFDSIWLWHVIEHLDNLDQAVIALRGRVAPYGKIVIAAPNFASFQAKMGRADWYHLDPPRHKHHLSCEHLKILAARHGMLVEKCFFNSFFQNFMGDLITLTNILLPGKNVLLNGLRRNRRYFSRYGELRGWTLFFIVLLCSVIFLLPVALFTLVSQITKRPGTVVAILRAP